MSIRPQDHSAASIPASSSPHDLARQVVRGERECVASHPGRSQYSAGGMSSCGLAALNCARIVLHNEMQGNIKGDQLLTKLTERATCENILSICAQWYGSAHLEVEDIYKSPIFETSLALCWSDYDQPGQAQFISLLRRVAQNSTRSAAVIITRPPEIICVLKIALQDRHKFITFDSHPRRKHPEGAAFIFHPSIDAAAAYLSRLLQYDNHLLHDPTLQWQAQLLGQYSAHMFVARLDAALHKSSNPSHGPLLEELLIRTSLTMLRLKAEVVDLQERNRLLESDLKGVTSAKDQLECRLSEARSRKSPVIGPAPVPMNIVRQVGQSSRFTGATLPVSPPKSCGPSTFLSHTQASAKLTASQPSITISHPYQSTMQATDELDDNGDVFATRISFKRLDLAQQKPIDDGLAMALQEQLRYEQEDRELRAQMLDLRKTEQRTFDCGICMETHPEDFVARIDLCGHRFCRSCMLQYVRTKLNSGDQRRFPILCPTCTAEQGSHEPGVVSGMLAQQAGLNEKEYSIFTELELGIFSVQLHCRGCQQIMFVDRDEYAEFDVIACPLPGCMFAWCKACSRSVEIGGPQHSCDGTSELAHLMEEQGWKSCPGCHTPTSKVDGCNHMTCIVPGCNMHFCYLCGENIVQSVQRRVIQAAVEQHFNRCRLFDIAT